VRIIRDAVEAVQENLPALAIYLALTVGANLLSSACGLVVEREVFGKLDNASNVLVLIPVYLIVCVAYAVAQSVVFAQMGKEIDRPLWKIAGAKEAVRRFFPLWFTISFVTLATLQISDSLARTGNPELGMLLYYGLFMSITLVGVPVGACIMFYGKLEWPNLGEILIPLARQFPMTMAILLLNLFQFLLMGVLMSSDAGAAAKPDVFMTLFKGTALAVVGGYIDCVVFAGVWLICMADRDTDHERDDFDF
jgi:hypothetical protein